MWSPSADGLQSCLSVFRRKVRKCSTAAVRSRFSDWTVSGSKKVKIRVNGREDGAQEIRNLPEPARHGEDVPEREEKPEEEQES